MEPQTCPHCGMLVLFSADGICPSCRTPATVAAVVAKAPRPHSFSEVGVATSDRRPPVAEVNPYHAPSFSVDRHPRADAASAHQGVMWILFSFQGRIPRSVFWCASLITTFAFYVAVVLLIFAFGEESAVTVVGLVALYGPMIWISLAITVKRWHDRDKSGWWILIGLLPIVGPLVQFVETGCLRGTIGDNQYGPDPLAVGRVESFRRGYSEQLAAYDNLKPKPFNPHEDLKSTRTCPQCGRQNSISALVCPRCETRMTQ